MLKSTLSLLVTFIVTIAAQTADDYKIDTLPGLDIKEAEGLTQQYAGHIEIASDTNSNLFFWMIEQAQKTNPEKLIIWLNGGPGCSSMDGLFLENGPYRVNPDLSVNISSGGWQDHATIVYLDQPVGTGFSFSDMSGYSKNMLEIVDGFMLFLDKFFEIFPKLKEQDLYIAGESFAGTYIPYFTTKILENNKNKDSNKYNLQGIAIGNGWISPEHQYDAYYDFAVQNDLLNGTHKEYAKTTLDKCHQLMEKQGDDLQVHVNTCESVLTSIVDSSVFVDDNIKYCINQYDIRLTKEQYPSCGMAWPYELSDVTTYLRRPELVRAIHADKQSGGWTECSSAVSKKLEGTNSKSAYSMIPEILNEIPILLFSGDQDLICNVLGTQYLIGNMTWNGAQGFEEAKVEDWFIDNKTVGSYTEARNLTLVIINDGSHMVPYDKPIETLDMINRFMGVGNNQVKGLSSRIGENKDDSSIVKPQGQETNPPNNEEEEEEDKDPWAQYYSWGTSALIVVLLFAGLLGYCWCKNRKSKQQGYRAPPSSRGAPGSSSSPGRVFGGGFLGLFGKGKRNKRPKLRLDDQDDTNELDELVIETPTLFAAEDYSDGDGSGDTNLGNKNNTKTLPTSSKNNDTTTTTTTNKQTRFAIAEEEDDDDDDFEDFADWDEESNIVDKKGDKRH